MNTTELSVSGFINLLSTDEPAPGGGAAVALSGATGIALLSMVANLTTGREKYKDEEELMKSIISEATKLKHSFIESINKDVKAYKNVMDSYKLPKDTEENKKIRLDTIQNSLKSATIVPFDVMIISLKSLELTEKAVGHSNANVITDLGISAINLKSAVQGAWLNVLVNLKYIKDENFVKEYESKGKDILEKVSSIADKIYQEVIDTLAK